MKNQMQSLSRRAGFTLIELLVVISIIAVLAALIFPAAAIIKKKAAINRVKTEMKLVEAAIDAYKENVKTLPPENPANPELNLLYYELAGTKLVAGEYQPVSGSGNITAGNLTSFFGMSGLQNVTRGNEDELKTAKNCLSNVRPSQYLAVTNGAGVTAVLLGTRSKGPLTLSDPTLNTINPWRYRSSSATNNPGGYDLWVDVTIGSSNYRISNWSDKEIAF